MEPISGMVPLDAWGGWLGEGLGPGKSLYFSTGIREGGNRSTLWRLDEGSDEWVDEGISDAETMNKIRSNAEKIYVFYESPPEGKTWMISKSLQHSGSGGWEFEPLHTSGSPVGGRGVAINGPEGEKLFGGCSQNWNAGGKEAEVYEKSGGGWSKTNELTPSLLWELEFDDEDRLWEFFSNFSGDLEAALFVGGEPKEPPPGGNISHACWFRGHMYVIGNLSKEESSKIYRSADGSEWEEVHTLEEAAIGDHVQMVARGEDGELWYTGHDPFEAGYSLDGEEWVREESVPSFPTGSDTNHLTALAYWGPDTDDEKERAVYLFAKDSDAGTTRIFRDRGAGSVILQII
jgi:hypothetical protein